MANHYIAGNPSVVYICGGSDCRKNHPSAHAALVAEVGSAATVCDVRCQGICKGPVAGVSVSGRVEWFARLSKGKARRALLTLVGDGDDDWPQRLAKRHVAKRSGRLRT